MIPCDVGQEYWQEGHVAGGGVNAQTFSFCTETVPDPHVTEAEPDHCITIRIGPDRADPLHFIYFSFNFYFALISFQARLLYLFT